MHVDNVVNEVKSVSRICSNMIGKLPHSGDLNFNVFDFCGRSVKNMFFYLHELRPQHFEFQYLKVHILSLNVVGLT